MSKLFLILLTILTISLSYGQKKIVLKNGYKRQILKKGKTIGITKKNEFFKYQDWNSSCSSCIDSTCRENIWTLDSIVMNYIVLKQLIQNDSAFKFDTITYHDNKKLKEYSRNWHFVKLLKSGDNNNNNRLVYKYPKYYNKQKILIDSISSFTFSNNENCTGFGIAVPLACLMFIIGTPFVAFDNGQFSPGILIVGETIGIGMTYLVYRHVKGLRVKTYNLRNWTIKIK